MLPKRVGFLIFLPVSDKTFKPVCKPIFLHNSNGGRTIESSSDCQQWQLAILPSPVITAGVHYCEFRIDECSTKGVGNIWKLMIGVTSPTDTLEIPERAWLGEVSGRFSVGYAAANGGIITPQYSDRTLQNSVVTALLA
jgi:hypothetical protein